VGYRANLGPAWKSDPLKKPKRLPVVYTPDEATGEDVLEYTVMINAPVPDDPEDNSTD
jgi:hypothetical protein